MSHSPKSAHKWCNRSTPTGASQQRDSIVCPSAILCTESAIIIIFFQAEHIHDRWLNWPDLLQRAHVEEKNLFALWKRFKVSASLHFYLRSAGRNSYSITPKCLPPPQERLFAFSRSNKIGWELVNLSQAAKGAARPPLIALCGRSDKTKCVTRFIICFCLQSSLPASERTVSKRLPCVE